MTVRLVIPAKAGTQGAKLPRTRPWTPASAGATVVDGLSFLLDVPQKDDRRDDDSFEILAVGGRRDELAGRHVGDVVGIGLDLNISGRLLLHRKVRRLEPGVDQLFDLRVGRPAEPGLLPISADREVNCRREEIRCRGPGVKDAPTAFFDGLL